MYVFIHNMPGYLPESEPEVYSTFDDAKRAAIDYMDREGDFLAQSEDEDDRGAADTLSAEMEELNLESGPEWSTVVGNVAYSISVVDAHELNEAILTDENIDQVTRFAWPGGYRVWYVTSDGADLCAECVSAELMQCVDPDSGGWYVAGHYHEGEADEAGPCDHCGRTSDIANV